ncbi:MAG: hypothetical protein IKY61_09675 [Thermoguttaceae bacterium]|nr:hypothetical protein [Thermoguttaceae bacterium]
MKNKFDARIFVVAALAVALAASTGCRSGWKMGNPFSKAPKATDVDTPSELDELNDLTPPPENYTVGDASPKKVDAEKSLAQKGKYEADETSKLAQTPDDASMLAQNSSSNASGATSANALAANLPPEPTQSFKTPDYSQSYQSADNFQSVQTAQTTQTPSATQPYQAPYSAPNAAAQQYAATAPYVPTQPTQNDFPTVDPHAFPVAQNAPVAPQNDFPAVDPNAFPVAQNAPVAPQNDFPTVDPNAFPVAQNAPVAPQNDFPTVDPNAFPTAQNAPVAPAPAQPTYVAQNFPEPTAQTVPVAPAQDAYSGVQYQPQTTSGGFAPGSVGVY